MNLKEPLPSSDYQQNQISPSLYFSIVTLKHLETSVAAIQPPC
jgi:hypothetical protein